MNEEEKKAIEYLKEYKDVVYKLPFKTILDLIEKQQKEIEDWKFTTKYVEDNYINKNEIRQLIENNEEDIDYSIHDIIEDLKKLID